jgi:RNA polymerase sigma factor (sigma-70 family)
MITTVSNEQMQAAAKDPSLLHERRTKDGEPIDSDRLGEVEGIMQNVAGSTSQSEPTDERLLRDYVASQDAGAFAAIMRRHGGMVSAVCRRMLWREQDVEDAFQATFLVLMRKASSLSRPNLLGHWLYGVSYRIANKIRSANIQQRMREAPMVDLPAPEADDDVSWRDLRSVLDDELQRLPQRYRRPLVLFYLEGKSAEEVATALGRPRGTVLSQLARGRERLRVLLTRRNLILSAGVLASLLERAASSDAAVPARFLDWALQAHASSLTVGGAGAGVSAQARLLAQQVLKDMFRRRLWTIGSRFLAVLLALVVCILSYAAILAPPVAVVHADPRSELGGLQGEWRVIAVERDGRVLPKDEFPFTRLRIRDENILHEGGDHDQEVSFRLHPEQQPRAMDMQSTGYHGEKTYNAIYSLQGDTLTICRPDDAARPTEFASKPGLNILLYTATRIQTAGP